MQICQHKKLHVCVRSEKILNSLRINIFLAKPMQGKLHHKSFNWPIGKASQISSACWCCQPTICQPTGRAHAVSSPYKDKSKQILWVSLEPWGGRRGRSYLGAASFSVWPTGIPRCRFFTKTATQKDRKHPSFSPRCFFSLNKRFSKVSNSIYLFNKRALILKKPSRHFE